MAPLTRWTLSKHGPKRVSPSSSHLRSKCSDLPLLVPRGGVCAPRCHRLGRGRALAFTVGSRDPLIYPPR